jgi:sec-independent protein translocase protein TatC
MARSVQTPNLTTNSSGKPSELPTFLDHVYELRRRLFWVVAVILVASSVAYPFLDTILSVITAPLAGQQLYYLTPVGGFSFSIKICFYVGIIVAVPIIMYHLYRYIEPLMGQTLRRSALFYVGLSALMASIGVVFAYYVSLPGALHFLTGMDLKNIQAMLTVDSYLTFVMTYLLGAALLFQIPLLLAITNNMTPLQPKKLMKAQRFVIVGAFIIAAIISPTPDIMNQVLLALPVIAMYQVGVGLVWLQNRSRAKRAKRAATTDLPTFEFKDLSLDEEIAPKPSHSVAAVISTQPVMHRGVGTNPQPKLHTPSKVHVAKLAPRRVSMDGFAPPQHTQKAVSQVQKQTVTPMVNPQRAPRPSVQTTDILAQPRRSRPVQSIAPREIRVPARSVDGFMLHRHTQMASSS